MISLVWPGDCPVTQPYACTDVSVEPVDPACPGGHFHTGIDIGMGIGTQLFAARAGVVDYVGYALLAIRVGTEHDWYLHIDHVAAGIFSGATIVQGQLVAYSGNKAPAGGFTTGPHLHFETQRGALNQIATSLNPVPILQGEEMPQFVIGPVPPGEIWKVDGVPCHVGPLEWQNVWQKLAVKPVPLPVDAATLAEIKAGVPSAAFPSTVTFSGAGTIK